jgi:hypothetical protein
MVDGVGNSAMLAGMRVVRFGIGVSRYLARLHMILQGSEGQSLSADQRSMLQEVIAQRGAATDTDDGR